MTNDDKAQDWCSHELPCARYEALSAENKRLREALRDVLVYAPDFMHGMPKKHYEMLANGEL